MACDKGQGPQYAEIAAAIHKGMTFGKRKYDVQALGFTTKLKDGILVYSDSLILERRLYYDTFDLKYREMPAEEK